MNSGPKLSNYKSVLFGWMINGLSYNHLVKMVRYVTISCTQYIMQRLPYSTVIQSRQYRSLLHLKGQSTLTTFFPAFFSIKLYQTRYSKCAKCMYVCVCGNPRIIPIGVRQLCGRLQCLLGRSEGMPSVQMMGAGESRR